MIARESRRCTADHPREGLSRRLWLALPATLIALTLTPASSLADNVYWSDSSATELRSGNLNGTGALTLFTGEQEPQGIAIDSSAGKIYWADPATNQIRVGNLSGTGSPQTLYTEPEGSRPTGVAINAGAGKLYWTDEGTGQVRVGSLAGGSSPQTLFSEPSGSDLTGIAIDSGTSKLYWTDEGSGLIREGPLSGGAATTLYTEPGGSHPSGIAMNVAAARLYWTDEGDGEIRYGPAGAGVAQTLYTEPAGSAPRGISIDVPTGVLYWGDSGTGALRVASISGASVPQSLFAPESGAAFPALVTAPSGAGIPKIAGPYNFGQTLVCGTGAWSSSLPGAGLYRTPQSYSYQWLRNGAAIAGAQSAPYLPSSEGSYTCVVTASTAGGSAVQTSLPAVVKARPPAASIAAPASGGTYERGQHVHTSFVCTEGAGGPGLASCTDSNGASAPGGALFTSTLGFHTYTVIAVSQNGQRASARISYTVKAAKAKTKAKAKTRVKVIAHPRIAILTYRTIVVGRRTRILLSCSGGGQCRGVLSLAIQVRKADGRARRQFVMVLFARSGYAVPSGRSRAITLQISRQARRLLVRARGRRLRVRTRATVNGGFAKGREVVLRLIR